MASPQHDDTKRIEIETGNAGDFDPSGLGWLVGSLSNDGMVRMNNEDAIYTFTSKLDDSEPMPTFGIFIMADGAGGHENGEKASSLTARTVSAEVIQQIYLPMLRGEDINNPDRPTIQEVLTQALTAANDIVREQVPDGGCTCTAAVINDNTLHIAHVGDSRLYLINDEDITTLTRDHSVVGRLVEIGQIDKAEARNHPQASVLYRGIGMGKDDSFDVDIYRKRLKAGDSILLCSDGLWDLVDDEDIHKAVTTISLPQQACKNLVTQANINGGHDNIPVIIVSSVMS